MSKKIELQSCNYYATTNTLEESEKKRVALENFRRVPQVIIVNNHLDLLDAADTVFSVTMSSD